MLTRPIVSQLVQIITGHTYLKRHQAIIDEAERQRIIEANGFDNADDDGNAIIDAPDPKCTRCNDGEETPLHILSECDSLATLRKDVFGREDLVPPGAIPDFSDLKVHQVISFFRDAKFESYTMRPFHQEYYPTHLPGNESNTDMIAEKEKATLEGNEYLAKYLYHVPREEGKPSKKGHESTQTTTNPETGESQDITQPINQELHSEDEF